MRNIRFPLFMIVVDFFYFLAMIFLSLHALIVRHDIFNSIIFAIFSIVALCWVANWKKEYDDEY